MDLLYNKRNEKSIREEFEDLGSGFDFVGIKDLISNLRYLRDKGIYDEFFNVFKDWEGPISVSTTMYKELQSISPLLNQAVSNGLTPENSNIFSSYIDYFSFYHVYRFLEWVYSMNLGRYLQEEDVEAVFSSDILEKIIVGQENFANIHAAHLNNSFFNDIQEVNWTDKNTERFFDKLHDLLTSKSFNEMGNREALFQRELKRITKFLTICSTVNKGKTNITNIEVITAYKILFKIIRTDITDLVNKEAYNGVLTCPVCNGYYNLEEDETPDDFSQCSCGGTLIYTSSLEEADQDIDTIKGQIIDERGLIAGATTSLTFALIFNNIILLTLLSGVITVLMAKNYTNNFEYGFLTGNISGALYSVGVFIFGIIMSGIKLNNLSSIDGSIIFIFIMVLGVLVIYCGRIGTFLVNRSKNNNIST